MLFWRHAQAHDAAPGQHDWHRALTPKGQQQAARVAAWLHQALPAHTRVLVSPAVRARQTADALAALGRPYVVLPAISPEAEVADLLHAAGWPPGQGRAPNIPVLLVGHQPTLGQAIAQLLHMAGGTCSVKKGAVWWLRARQRQAAPQLVLQAVQGPDTLF